MSDGGRETGLDRLLSLVFEKRQSGLIAPRQKPEDAPVAPSRRRMRYSKARAGITKEPTWKKKRRNRAANKRAHLARRVNW